MLHMLALALQITAPQTTPTQPPAQAPTRVQAIAADPTGAQPISLAEFPTRKNPFTLTGKMTITTATPTGFQGSMVNEGLAEGGGGRSGKRGASSGTGGLSMRSSCSYAIQVPPGAKLKVTLSCRRLRSFNVHFISNTYGRTEDPGLFVNRLHHRDDVAFYENKDKEIRTIHCVLLGVEPMVDEPYSLVFTDY
jgi:hypothetical protein